jgi:hypothetical protein
MRVALRPQHKEKKRTAEQQQRYGDNSESFHVLTLSEVVADSTGIAEGMPVS